MWWRNGEQLEDVGRRTPMRRCEVEESWRRTEMCCVWHCFYTLKKEKWTFMNLAAEDEKIIWTPRHLWRHQAVDLWTLRMRMIKEFNPRGICGGHLWTLRMRMRKILNPIFKYLNSFFGLNWLNEYEKDFEPNILIPLKEGIGIDLWFWPCSFCGRHLVDL